MTEGNSEFSDESDVDAAALRWLLRLAEADLRSEPLLRAEFVRWRDADARHAAAFAQLDTAWQGVEAHAGAPELLALRRQACEELGQLRDTRRRRKQRTWIFGGGLAFAMAATITLAAINFWPQQAWTVTTGIGEQRTVDLKDGSRVELDADSQISVAFTSRARLVNLLRGQAFFKVAKEPGRAFVVACHERTVVATGTAFAVEALDRGLHVTLVDGHVLVKSAASDVLDTLEPGDSLTSIVGEPSHLEHRANLLALLAWRTGHLLFDDVPLAEAIARMGHYRRAIVRVDPAVGAIRISGVFATGDLGALLRAVQAYYPVTARTDADGTIALSRRR